MHRNLWGLVADEKIENYENIMKYKLVSIAGECALKPVIIMSL